MDKNDVRLIDVYIDTIDVYIDAVDTDVMAAWNRIKEDNAMLENKAKSLSITCGAVMAKLLAARDVIVKELRQ